MREELVARHARGRSFADIGCMWQVDGAIAFAAEAAGATAVTGMDLMPASPGFERERVRRRSSVRFVQGDLHDERALAEVGEHDVVWCSGVLYHAPHPLLTLQRLRTITGGTLLLATETLAAPGRLAVYAPARWMHPARPAPPDPTTGYAGWYWLPSRATVRALLTTAGFAVADEHGRGPFRRTFVATPSR